MEELLRPAVLPTGYTVRTIVPAEKEELVSVAKAMHREKFAKSTKELFHLEKEAALKSLQTGGWEPPCSDPWRAGPGCLCHDTSCKPQQGPSSPNSEQERIATRSCYLSSNRQALVFLVRRRGRPWAESKPFPRLASWTSLHHHHHHPWQERGRSFEAAGWDSSCLGQGPPTAPTPSLCKPTY